MDKTQYDEFADWRRLRNAIFKRITEDYKALVKGEIEPTRNCNLIEIESFLKSKRCKDLLADCTHCTGESILQSLKEWEEQYHAQQEKDSAVQE